MGPGWFGGCRSRRGRCSDQVDKISIGFVHLNGCSSGPLPLITYDTLLAELPLRPQRWLVTGVAGFIGSHLLESLLKLDQTVVGLDDFSTGHATNLDQVREAVRAGQWQRFDLIEGDIRELATCRRVCTGVDYVLHQAALGSVPRSIEDPLTTNAANIDGFLNMLVAARDARVQRFVYAASSSTYGDHPELPKVEEVIGRPLSPYAVTKYVNELYAEVFDRCYGVESVGLRYFNVFGPRQDPNGAYAAVIPCWIAALIRGEPVYINGDGETSRDFCYVDNAVQANLLAALQPGSDAAHEVYNVAVGERTTLLELFDAIRQALVAYYPAVQGAEPRFREPRPGDVRHSQASIDKARERLGYAPRYRIADGLREAIAWYIGHVG